MHSHVIIDQDIQLFQSKTKWLLSANSSSAISTVPCMLINWWPVKCSLVRSVPNLLSDRHVNLLHLISMFILTLSPLTLILLVFEQGVCDHRHCSFQYIAIQKRFLVLCKKMCRSKRSFHCCLRLFHRPRKKRILFTQSVQLRGGGVRLSTEGGGGGCARS